MNSLRDIVRRHEEEQTLREYYKDKYDDTPDEEKKKMLDFLRSEGNIDKKVNLILDTFVKEIEEGSPAKQRRKKIAWGYTAVTIITTPTIGYLVNQKSWSAVICVSLILLIVSGFNIYLTQ